MKLIPLFILIIFFPEHHGFEAQEVSRVQRVLECHAIWPYLVVMGAQRLIEKMLASTKTGETCPKACNLMIQQDGYLSCKQCKDISRKEENCIIYGKLTVIEDRPVVDEDPLRALHTLPYGLFISKSKIPNAGLGVFTSIDIPQMVRFGPYIGSTHDHHDAEYTDREATLYSWQVRQKNGELTLINALNVSHSNYLRYVNTPNCKRDANTFAVQHNLDIYYVTLGRIPAGSELLVWYGKQYAMHLGLQDLDCNKHVNLA